MDMDLEYKGEIMNEQIYVSIIIDLANQLASKSIDEAEFKARLTESQQEKEQLSQEVESYRSVLESDKDLMDLFNEIKTKNEVNK
jgi:hypothetical protein